MKYNRIAVISRDSGQGEVWRGEDSTGAEVAIKYVKLPVAIEEVGTELKRFEREIHCQSQLDHPNIVKIIASDLNADKPHFVMPLASGSLRELLSLHRDGMPEDDAVTLMMSVLDAMEYAHREGVVHRDIKPENILMFSNQPALADFGLGRRLQSGSTTITIANVGLGTLQYSAPEQLLNGHDGDERSDVYSLGRVFYEVLTGRVPFPRMDIQAVPAKFRHVIFTATMDDPDARYQTVVAMIHDLKVVVNGYESLRTPLARASGLFDALSAEDGGSAADAKALSRLLVEHGDDVELYDNLMLRSSAELMEALAGVSLPAFEQIVVALDRNTDRHFDFEDVDSVADALVDAFWANESIELRKILMRRLMILATTHNRFYIAKRFSGLVSRAIQEQVYVQIVVGLLHDNPACKEFLRFGLLKKSLPPLIEQELAA